MSTSTTSTLLGKGKFGFVSRETAEWVQKVAQPGEWAEAELREEYLNYGAMNKLQGRLIPMMHPSSSPTRLVLEHIEGRTLQDLAESTSTSPYAFGVALLHATGCLAALHAAGWAHGDSHGRNILINHKGARLIDLSFAQFDNLAAPKGIFEEWCYKDFCLLAESFQGVVSPQKWSIVKAMLSAYL